MSIARTVRLPRAVLLVALVAAVLVLAACTRQEPSVSVEDQVPADVRAAMQPEEEGGEGGEGDGAAGGGEVASFTAIDNQFTSFPDSIPAGEVTIELVNEGNLEHDISIEETGEDIVTIGGGETATGTTTLEPGEYTFFCSVPGHESTMNEVIAVE